MDSIGYEFLQQKLNDQSAKLVRHHINRLLCTQKTASAAQVLMEDVVKRLCEEVVSKSVHDPVYLSVMREEIKVLSRGNLVQKALAKALSKMLDLSGSVDKKTIPREKTLFECVAAPMGDGCSILNEPLRTFMFTAFNEPVEYDKTAGVPCYLVETPTGAHSANHLQATSFSHHQSLGKKLGGAFSTGCFNPMDLIGDQNEFLQQYHNDQSSKLVRPHINWLLDAQKTAPAARVSMEGVVKRLCEEVVSESVHDPIYRSVMREEIKVLSRGNLVQKALAKALSKMLDLGGSVDKKTIPRDYSIVAAPMGVGCSILNEPLITFVFTAFNEPAFTFTPHHRSLRQKLGGVLSRLRSFWLGETKVGPFDIESQMHAIPKSTVFGYLVTAENNITIAGLAGATAVGVMASMEKGSPSLYVRFLLAAAALGMNGNLIAAFTRKHPWLTAVLTKVGGIGVTSEVILALGDVIDTPALGKYTVKALVFSLICLVNAMVIWGIKMPTNENSDPNEILVPEESFMLRLEAKVNLAVAGFGGGVVVGVLASVEKDSPPSPYVSFVLIPSAAVGIIGSFFAALTRNRPRLSGVLSKVGGIGVASEVIIALGNAVDTLMLGKLNVNALVIALICLINVVLICI